MTEESLNMADISLVVKNFRAIHEAHIKINGITVVAGVNGSGKSTLSKLLYYVFYVTNNFSVSVANVMNQEIRILERAIMYLIQASRTNTSKYIGFRRELERVFDSFRDDALNVESTNNILRFIDSLSTFLSSYPLDDNELSRIYRIFNNLFSKGNTNINIRNEYYNLLSPSIIKRNKLDFGHTQLIEFLKHYVFQIHEAWNRHLVTRPKQFLDAEIISAFNTQNKPDYLEVIEYGVPIVSNEAYMQPPFVIENVIYIDTPMLLGMNEVEHWRHTNNKLGNTLNNYMYSSSILKLIDSDVLQGKGLIEYDENRNCFIFKNSEDTFAIDLEDCATGIKAFGIINILLKNGTINDKTLLIIDEPETHLHPQWIVEYARLLTLIHKHIGTKIFVVTHNPDMVQSLKYIPIKENIGDTVTFYNAVSTGKNLQYQYNELGDDIHEIFESFNISYDKLELYGADSNEV